MGRSATLTIKGNQMSDIARRLEILKSYYADELKQSNPSKGYLDDLQGSIAYCEGLLQKGYTIIQSPEI